MCRPTIRRLCTVGGATRPIRQPIGHRTPLTTLVTTPARPSRQDSRGALVSLPPVQSSATATRVGVEATSTSTPTRPRTLTATLIAAKSRDREVAGSTMRAIARASPIGTMPRAINLPVRRVPTGDPSIVGVVPIRVRGSAQATGRGQATAQPPLTGAAPGTGHQSTTDQPAAIGQQRQTAPPRLTGGAHRIAAALAT